VSELRRLLKRFSEPPITIKFNNYAITSINVFALPTSCVGFLMPILCYQNYDGVTHEFFGMASIVPEAKQAQTLATLQLKKYLQQT